MVGFGPSGVGELDKCSDVMRVGHTQSGYVMRPHLAGRGKIRAAPGKRTAAKAGNQQVGHEPRMAAIAVWEGVNGHQTVVKADCKFIGSEYGLLHPQMAVIEQAVKFGSNTPGRNTNIALCLAILPCPSPDVAKHPLVQVSQKALV